VISHFGESGLHVVIRRLELRLLGRRNLSGDCCRFSHGRQKNPQLDERRVGEFCFVDMRAVFRNGQALSSPFGESADLSCQTEFDGLA
jgi:hypothetical protein